MNHCMTVNYVRWHYVHKISCIYLKILQSKHIILDTMVWSAIVFWLQVIWLLCQVLQKLSWFHVIKINIKYVLALQNPLTRMLCIGHPVLIDCFLSVSTKSILESYMIVMPAAPETILVWLLIFCVDLCYIITLCYFTSCVCSAVFISTYLSISLDYSFSQYSGFQGNGFWYKLIVLE